MTDNVVANPGTGGATFATDDIGGVHHPRHKVGWGPDGTFNDTDDASGKRLPVKIGEALPAGTNNIGDVDVVSLPPGSVAGTAAKIVDYDPGVGTDLVAMFGIALPKSGGAVAGGTASDPVRVDPTGTTTQPISAASLPLPSGAATEATLSGVRTSVELLDDSVGTLGAAAPSKGLLAAGSDGTNARALKTDANGELQVDVLSLPAVDTELPSAAALADGASNPTTPTVGSANLLYNGTSWDRARGDTTNGLDVDVTRVQGTVTVGAHDLSGSALAALQLIDDPVVPDDAAFTVGTSKVQVAGFLADEASTDLVDEGDVGAARITLDRKQVVAQYAHVSGGWTPYKLISAASTNATSVKASAGQVGVILVTNTNASPRYLKFYNKASAPSVGTDTPVLTLAIPGNSAGAGISLPAGAGFEFTTGIAFALTTAPEDSSIGPVAANEIIVNLGYK